MAHTLNAHETAAATHIKEVHMPQRLVHSVCTLNTSPPLASAVPLDEARTADKLLNEPLTDEMVELITQVGRAVDRKCKL
jgi:hypothetical protein